MYEPKLDRGGVTCAPSSENRALRRAVASVNGKAVNHPDKEFSEMTLKILGPKYEL